MRTYSLYLLQNLGDGAMGAFLDLSSRIVSLGEISWEVDEQLTKLSPGGFTPTVEDHDGVVWDWLQTDAATSGAYYPPFLLLEVNGERKFTGTVSADQMTRSVRDRTVKLSAQDWSAMLSTQALDWSRPVPLAASNESAAPAAVTGCAPAAVMRGMTSPPAAQYACFVAPANWVQVGDLIDFTTPLGTFTGRKVQEILYDHTPPTGSAPWSGPEPGYTTYTTFVKIEGQVWTSGFTMQTGTFRRQVRTTEEVAYYEVAEAVGDVSENYTMRLKSIQGIVTGDRLRLINTTRSQEWTVLQTDAAGEQIITREEVKNLAVDDRIYFTEDCQNEVVFEDARGVILRACNPFGVDDSRYTPPTLPIPVLCWLPLRPKTGKDLLAVRDVDAGLASLRVFGSGDVAWDGSPDTGWAEAPDAYPRAHWTNQRTTAPSSLMPDETTNPTSTNPTPLSAQLPRRYRTWDLSFRSRMRDLEDILRGTWLWSFWLPTTIPGVVVYDYLNMRRVRVNDRAVTINAWSGTAWGTGTNVTWPGASAVKSACVFPGGPSGMVLGLTAQGLIGVTLPGLSPQTAAYAIPASASDGVLRTTPWGAYLVGSRGYGKITHSAGVLSMAWVEVIAENGGSLLPNTFAGIDEDHVTVLARFDTKDAGEEKTTTETHALLLQAEPTLAETAVVWSDKVLEGAPITAGAMRDPVTADRVIGHCGGRLYQIGWTLPVAYALERFVPKNMTASELLEHVCQVIHAVAIPRADGTMMIVSRTNLSAQSLTVDQVSIEETRAWQHFYTYIRVTGAEDGLLYDAMGSTDGGGLLEISQHPMVWSQSGCRAMAEGLASWFGEPRRLQQQSWFYTDTNTAAPWESVLALATLTVNSDSVARLLIGLSYKIDKGEATAKLVEV